MSAPLPSPTPTDTAAPRRLLGATLLLALGRQWGSLCTLLGLAVLARTLPLPEFGRYTFFLALFALFDVLADGGTSTLVLQRGSHDPWAFTSYLAGARRARGRLALLTWILFTAGLALSGEPRWGWLALAAAHVFTRPLELSSIVFQRDLLWGRPVALRALLATLRVVLLVGLVLAGVRDAAFLVLAHGSCLALGNLLLHLIARERLPRPTVPVALPAGLLAAALPFGAAALLQQAYFYLDNLFVRAFAGDAELGQYNAAVRVFSFSVLFATLGTQAALPWLARRHHAGETGDALARLLPPSVGLGAVLAGALDPHTRRLMGTLFGAEFQEAGASLHLLLFATLGVHAGAVLLTGVVATGRGRAVLGIAACAVLTNVLANALLVPSRGAAGAALATAVTEGLVAVLAALLLLRHGALAPRQLLRPTLALLLYPAARGISTLFA